MIRFTNIQRIFQAIFIFTFLVPAKLPAQENIPLKKSLYFELAGSGGFFSLNYEKFIFKSTQPQFTFRAGISIAPIDKNNGSGIVFPVMVNALFGKTAHKLEAGLGQGITITTKGHFFARATGVLGYRFQQPGKQWFYRVSYTPIVSYLVDFQYTNWFGLSIGYSFHQKQIK